MLPAGDLSKILLSESLVLNPNDFEESYFYIVIFKILVDFNVTCSPTKKKIPSLLYENLQISI